MSRRRTTLTSGIAAFVLMLLNTAAAEAAITQPPQPRSGPGGSDYSHDGVRVSSGGTGADAWYVFEPTRPRPARAPLAIMMHGYYEFAGYNQLYELIHHTVRKGSIVIYPRWQTDVAVPCPGPIDIEPCMSSAVSGINGALDYLRADSNRVQPQLGKASYFGFSFGGIITANLANRWRSLGLPKPRAVFLEDPHDGGLVGFDEPALDDSMAGIPKGVKLECHSSADGVTGEPEKANSSCNALFPMLGQIPNRNKDLVHDPSRRSWRTAADRTPRRLRKSAGHGRRLRLELLLEGLGRATRLRLLRHSPSLRARRHPSPSVERQVERRDPDQAAEGPEHRADQALAANFPIAHVQSSLLRR